MAESLDVNEALKLLLKLREAAPDSTAYRLGQVMRLIRDLSEENAYLNARVEEAAFGGAEVAHPTPAESMSSTDYANGDLIGMLVSMNDALRPPLVAIRGRAELIQAGMLGQITDEQARWLDAIQENTDRSFRLLDAVQRLMAIRQQQVRIEWSDFIASDLLEEAYERIKDRTKAAGHHLKVQVPDVVPVAHGDFYQSLMILTDLLDNAVRYTPEGGDIRLSADSLGTHVLFSVADSGIGLRSQDMAHIGQPFWRADDHPLVRQHNGTGLSLYLAKLTLALQDGELICSGEPTLGSTFSFTLAVPA
jgi:signal transduction histidine kinase